MNWLNKIRTKVECALDYVWYVAERWGEITNNPKMSGSALFWIFWLWVVMLPFQTSNLLTRNLTNSELLKKKGFVLDEQDERNRE